jgi:hypothetical protein
VRRKDGRLGKDLTGYITGKSTDPTGNEAKRNKEPDIAVALSSGLKLRHCMSRSHCALT